MRSPRLRWITALFTSLISIAAGLSSAIAQIVVVPVPGATPTLTSVAINAGPGDQFDTHVSGDWAAYTSDIGIRYYNFSTGIDAQIPMGSSVNDLLAGVSGSRIVFSRVRVSGTAIFVFDAATAAAPVEIDPTTSPNRFGAAIGGNTVAYIDFGLQANGELVIHDLVTGISNRITFDTVGDGNPMVSSDGNVVTWEHCASSLSNCDVWQAVKTGTTWTVSVVSNTPNPEGNPDSNGSLVVYDSRRSGNSDIFWRSIAGGPEFQLQLTSYDIWPRTEGNYINFDSHATVIDPADLFVYDMVLNRLYQITNTPLVNEQLSDITVLPDGRVRVVWASDEDGADQRNVYGATFTPPSATCAPPTIAVSVSPSVLWPPNNQLVDIHATVSASSACDAHPTYALTSITESCSPKSGDIAGATYGTPDVDFQLRAAKCDRPGRIYTITYTATDNAGRTSTASATVTVPHDQKGHGEVVEDFKVRPVTLQTPGVVVAIRTEPASAGDAGDLVNHQAIGAPHVVPATEFDAKSVDASQIFLGTSSKLVAPTGTSFEDVNGDGADDLVLRFTGSDYQSLIAAPVSLDDPITLYYRTTTGVGYEQENLIAGAPIGLATSGGSLGGAQSPSAGGNEVSVTELAGAYPNPVRIGANVVFTLAHAERVDLAIYDVLGARVRTLETGMLAPGRYQASWNGRAEDGRKLTGGMYFVRFTAGSYAKTAKTLVMQ